MPIAGLPFKALPADGQSIDSLDGVGRPMLFQVTRVDSLEPLWPYALALHVNPSSLQEQFTKSENVVMTRGGLVEFVWPDDLDNLSAESTTGAFIGPDVGLAADSYNPDYKFGRGSRPIRDFSGRHGTMAWERHTDLLELFRSNGHIFNSGGVPIFRCQIMCMYDRGIYIGLFTTFEVTEDGETPFQFKLSWSFKVSRTIYTLPVSNEALMTSQPYGSLEKAGPREATDTPVAVQEDFFRNRGNT